jgi:hypothetical protein
MSGIGEIIKAILKYGIAAPLYMTFRWIIPILVLFGIPIFIAGMIVAIIGVMGHIFFILLFVFGLLYYFRFAYRIIYPSSKKDKRKKTKLKKHKKFSTSLGQGRRYNRNQYGYSNYRYY